MSYTTTAIIFDGSPEEYKKVIKEDALIGLAKTVFADLLKDKAHKYVLEISEREEPTLEAVEYTLQCKTFIVEQRDITEHTINQMTLLAHMEDESIKCLMAKLAKEIWRRLKKQFGKRRDHA